MKAERLARFVIVVLAIVLPAMALFARSDGGAIEIHARVAEDAGWAPGNLSVAAGEPLKLRLTSDDVVHGFAIGQGAWPSLDVMPGEIAETTLVFDKPGKYTFYCTRWCGPNHWRMRGTIEVSGSSSEVISNTPPLYMTLGLNIDDPHPSEVVPSIRPSAKRGADLGVTIPAGYATPEVYRTRTPESVWNDLRRPSLSNGLSDDQVWNLVALVWRSNASEQALAEGQKLFAQNCAACHGESGRGDGVMAGSLIKPAPMPDMAGHDTAAPVDFANGKNMLRASSAILQGKIIRGGMGTGMPYWGPILTDEQIWSLIDYLWSFQFDP
jgi:cytochrome c oxidase subunit 2